MKTILSWNQYLKLLRRIIDQIACDGYTPNLIVGIARGGMVPATMLASYYRTRNLGIVYIQKTISDQAFSEMLPQACAKGFYCPCDIRGKDVLLIDCIIQTGQTMNVALEIIEKEMPARVKMVSLFAHKKIEKKLDFFSPAEVDPDGWIVFPWEQLGKNE